MSRCRNRTRPARRAVIRTRSTCLCRIPAVCQLSSPHLGPVGLRLPRECPTESNVRPRRRPYLFTRPSTVMRTTWRTPSRSLRPRPGTEVGIISTLATRTVGPLPSLSRAFGFNATAADRWRYDTTPLYNMARISEYAEVHAGCDFRPGRDPMPLYVRGSLDMNAKEDVIDGAFNSLRQSGWFRSKGVMYPGGSTNTSARDEDSTPAVRRTDGI